MPEMSDKEEAMTQPTVSSLQVKRLRCGHCLIHMMVSAETGEDLYCEICDTRDRLSDALQMEAAYKAKLTTATTRITELERLNEILMRQRNFAPGGVNMLNGFLEERDEWKIKCGELEAQLRELQWKPITPESLPKAGDLAYRVSNGGLIFTEPETRIIYRVEETAQRWIDMGYTMYFFVPPAPSSSAQNEGE